MYCLHTEGEGCKIKERVKIAFCEKFDTKMTMHSAQAPSPGNMIQSRERGGLRIHDLESSVVVSLSRT